MSKGAATEINQNVHNNKTEVNESVQLSFFGNNETVINKNVNDASINSNVATDDTNFTMVNPKVKNYSIDIPSGTVLNNKYVIDVPLSTNTGEANLYLCTYRKRTYVAKVYRRQTAIKDDVIEALESVNSTNVAKLYETGIWNGAPFEIIPYYKYGSLEGKTFPYERLKKEIIPALNSGLNALHKKKIIHKDLKPSNIMLCDDQKNVAIIDFGISSIREGGNTVVVTKTGMTPEYSAPETFRTLFLEESDYYSLGITIYELFCGHTPYSGVAKETIEQYIAVQKIPFPKGFPEDLQKLIIGLTYTDITNRNDKDNPNRRWTYAEVKKWCNNEDVPLPGGGSISEEPVVSTAIPAMTFMYKRYTNVNSLVNALGQEWENGKKRLYRSLLTDYFRNVNQEIANYCIDAEEAVKKDRMASDIEFFRLLYRMNPQMQAFHWRTNHYASMTELGFEILKRLREKDIHKIREMDSLMHSKVFSVREATINTSGSDEGKRIARIISSIEEKYMLAQKNNDERTKLEQLYILGYYYSGSKTLITSFGSFNNIKSLIDFFKDVMKNSPEKMDTYSAELIISGKDYDNAQNNKVIEKPMPEFAGWLTAHKKGSVLR